MRLANLLPPSVELPPFPSLVSLSQKIRTDAAALEVIEGILQEMRTIIRNLPVGLRRYLGPVSRMTYFAVIERRHDLDEAVRVLRAVTGGETATLPLRSSLQINAGIIQFAQNPAVNALQGVEANRIRRCLLCEKFFWAGRIDRKCCSEKCRKNWHTRRWREKYPDTYKLRRILKNP